MTDELDAKIGFKVDPASLEQVKAAAQSVSASLQKVERAGQLNALAKAAAESARQLGSTEDAVVDLAIELNKLNASEAEIKAVTAAFLEQGRAIDKAAESAANLAAKQAEAASKEAEKASLSRLRADDANERLDTVRSGVGIAGDAASALNTIGGATGINFGPIPAILELAEALPLLKARTRRCSTPMAGSTSQ